MTFEKQLLYAKYASSLEDNISTNPFISQIKEALLQTDETTCIYVANILFKVFRALYHIQIDDKGRLDVLNKFKHEYKAVFAGINYLPVETAEIIFLFGEEKNFSSSGYKSLLVSLFEKLNFSTNKLTNRYLCRVILAVILNSGNYVKEPYKSIMRKIIELENSFDEINDDCLPLFLE